MTVARSQLVDLELTPYYHCISRCVRGAFLCGEGYEHRKDWIENRLEELADLFAVSVAGFAVLDNHLHVLVRLEGKQRVAPWSDREIAERWGRLFPPRDKKRQPLPVTEAWIQKKLGNQQWLEKTRRRLANLGWFMKCLKEPLARMANREEGCRGTFWEGRYKSIAVLDAEALLATCVYIDLNPVAAGIADVPENSPHTSIKARLDHVRHQGRWADLQAALQTTSTGCVLSTDAATGLEEQLWLCPLAGTVDASGHYAGLLEGFSLAQYLQLVDWTSRFVREGKRHVTRAVASILQRLDTSAEVWQATFQKMFARSQVLGVVFAFSRDRLQQAASRRGCHHVANLNGCPA